MRARGFTATAKADSSPVTEADLAADAIICAGLAAAYPDDGVLTEESGRSGFGAARTWVVDPLDGTEAFVDGTTRGYAVQIGLLVAEQPVLGVVYEPRGDMLFRALRGHGTFLERQGGTTGPLRVSTRTTLATMPLITSSTISAALRARLLSVGVGDAGTLRSVGVKVGEIVTGHADIYVSHHPVSFWDSCAPLVILEEAGGVATLLDGSPFSYPLAGAPRHRGPFVISNGQRHSDLCAAFTARWEA